jgi:uncharacterized OB-fold protein
MGPAAGREAKPQLPAVEGWFTTGKGEPRLLGSRCCSCGTFFFPKLRSFCANPACDGTRAEEVPLSRTGTLWSYTENRYPPPPPYMASDPFEPYVVAAVELDVERIVVLGQVVPGVGVEDLRVGKQMELVVGPLFEDQQHEYLVWKWRPIEKETANGA